MWCLVDKILKFIKLLKFYFKFILSFTGASMSILLCQHTDKPDMERN